jgi:hypothetical protein
MSGFRTAILILLLLICGVSFWLAHRAGEQRPPHGTPDQVPDAGAELSAALSRTIRLKVLNGSGEPGLARRFSRHLGAFGCVILSIDDAPHDSFQRSLLINRRLSTATARHLSARLNGVTTILEKDPRSQEDAVLVLGHDHRRLLIPEWQNPGSE